MQVRFVPKTRRDNGQSGGAAQDEGDDTTRVVCQALEHRVQRLGPTGTAVFAMALSGSGTIRLTAPTTTEVSEWLVYLVRRHLSRATA
jgi:hypothetical protein